MLPKELLVVTKNYPKIKPDFADLKDDLEIARKILEIYENNYNQPYYNIKDSVKELEKHDNFKMVRGLNKILKRRINFEKRFEKPKELREFLYRLGPALNQQKRKKILNKASEKFNINLDEDASDIIWADSDENLIVSDLDWISPIELLRNYNLSMAQTLIFNSIGLKFFIEDRFQNVLRHLKFLGLMYEIESPEPKIYVNGPSSLFKKTRKYGTSLAKLIPTIMRSSNWEIKADINFDKNNKSEKIYKFTLDKSDEDLFPEKNSYSEKEIKFDSTVEKNFYNDFKFLKDDWNIIREPRIVKSNSYAFIPDFGFVKNDLEYYLEIVGFWTDEYLRNKIQKINNSNINMAIAVNKELKCTKEDFKNNNNEVFFYDKKVPIKPIIKKLNQLENKKSNVNKRKNRKKIKSAIKKQTKNNKIVNLKNIAQKTDINEKTLKNLDFKEPEFKRIGNYLVRNTELENLKNEILELDGIRDNGIKYDKIKPILKKHNLTQIDINVLKQIGFKIEWETLDKNNSKIKLK